METDIMLQKLDDFTETGNFHGWLVVVYFEIQAADFLR